MISGNKHVAAVAESVGITAAGKIASLVKDAEDPEIHPEAFVAVTV